MYLLTQRGFYDVVQHSRRPSRVMVRARSRADLERLLELALPEWREQGRWPAVGEIHETFHRADYPYRVDIRKPEWATMLVRLTLEIDYSSFKTRLKARLGRHRYNIVSDCWAAILEVEDEDPKASLRNRLRRRVFDWRPREMRPALTGWAEPVEHEDDDWLDEPCDACGEPKYKCFCPMDTAMPVS